MRKTILAILVVITGLLVYLAVTADPVPGYGRLPTFASYGFFTFLIWIPYCITCLFLDRSKRLGFTTLGIVLAALGYFVVSMLFLGLGHAILSLIVCALAAPVLWAISTVNRFRKKMQNQALHGTAESRADAASSVP